ncbi:MAG: hypothetical protein WDZ77_03105 [Candidatus Pacearchaeota archaeon]
MIDEDIFDRIEGECYDEFNAYMLILEGNTSIPSVDIYRIEDNSEMRLSAGNEDYRIRFLDSQKSHATIRGGDLFRQTTPAIIDGSIQRNFLINRKIYLGLPLKITSLDGKVILPTVTEFAYFDKFTGLCNSSIAS